MSLVSSLFGQSPFVTSHGDNTRSGADTDETLLTPSNVNSNSFGHLFSSPVDYQVLAQPLYVPNVTINIGQFQGTTHNVVYVATQADSVYAFDADNGTQLWYASMLPPGAVPASGKYLPCGKTGGFAQEGIIGTPVVDLTTTPGTMYLVAKSLLNATVSHYLHALDITTGLDLEQPVLITATSTSQKNNTVNFNSLHQKNRPGLLLLNGVLYLGFGSNGCNDNNTGWVLAYDAVPTDPNYMGQVGAFNTSPDIGHTSIWQTGTGLAADEAGNIFAATAESTAYGGQSYSNSVLKLTPPPWSPQNVPNPSEPDEFFTPWNVAYLNSNDLDVSSVGPLILPDQQNGPANCSEQPCHEVIASGKSKVVYVLDRDSLGGFVPGGPTDPQILQEFSLTADGQLMCSPAYWNGLVYFMPDASPLQVFEVSNGLLSPYGQTTQELVGSHAPSISANGDSNGIVWLVSGNNLDAFNAVSLNLLYSSKVPTTLAHFATQTVANGKVYVATVSTLETYGLLQVLTVASGNNQTAQVLNPLPAPLQFVATNPYTNLPDVGVTVSFSDGNKGGSFNPATAVTDSNGNVFTTYTFPKIATTYTLTASSPGFGNVTATATATPAAAAKLVPHNGQGQTGAAGSVLPNPITAFAQDAYGNAVPGVTVNFTSTKGGVPNPASSVTNASGIASTYLQLPTIVTKLVVTAASSGLKSVTFQETSVAGPPASVTVTGGNNQTASAGTTLPQALNVVVADQYNNPVSGASVTFSDGGAGGTFNNPNPATTGSNGSATQSYTLPSSPGTVTITASVAGVANPGVFTETGD